MIQGSLGQAGIGQNIGDAGNLEAAAVNFAKRRIQDILAGKIGLTYCIHGSITYQPVWMCQAPEKSFS